MIELTRVAWAQGNPTFRQVFTSRFIPGGSPEQLQWFNDLCLKCTVGEAAARLFEARGAVDIEDMLPLVRVPTLVLHSRQDEVVPIAEGHLLASRIRGAEFVELDSRNHVLLEHEPAWERFKEAVLAFLPSGRPPAALAKFAALSSRERQVLTLITCGLSNAEIATQMQISEKKRCAITPRTFSISWVSGPGLRLSCSPATMDSKEKSSQSGGGYTRQCCRIRTVIVCFLKHASSGPERLTMGLTRALHRSLQLQPDAVAVCFGDRRRTFRQFTERVARLAGALQSLGVQPNDRVAMLALNSDRYLEYLMAVPWSGAVLNPCNIRWTAPEITDSLDDSGSTVLIFDDAFAPVAATICATAKTARTLIYAGDGPAPPGTHHFESLVDAASPVADAGRGANDLAGVFYTGGTTGHPKGVRLSHDNLVWHAVAAIATGLGSTDAVIVHAPPMFHVAGFAASQVYWLLGGRHVTIPAFRPDALAACIERERATDVVLVPTMIQLLLDDPVATTRYDLSSLRRIIYAASPISETLLDRALKAFPNVDFFHAYGLTESTGAVTWLGPEHHTAEGRKSGRIRSAGRGNFISLVRVIDTEGDELPRGEVGEIVVSGPTTMLGYWERPADTAAAICDGWLRTGDAGYMDENGFVYVVDRIKDMIITGGENVYSVEVEQALAKHPGVAACAVIGIPSEKWGESVQAFVVRKATHEVTVEDLDAHCHAQIANYKCPKSIEFLNALPVSGAGKVLKAKLREPFWQGRTRHIG